MLGSATFFPAATNEEVVNKSELNMMGTRQPPPVAPRTANITFQSWQQATSGGDANYGKERYARSASSDSLESSGSSSSGGANANNRMAEVGTVEYIPTRTVGKTPKLPPHNPLQFVKVQSALYKKAEEQIQLTKEVKICREALKEGEEEWQSNLDNWKSRRRKVSEKVIQRAEEMRKIEAEEQLRQEQLLQQQRKIKKFSEIVEKKSRTYNLELYIGQGGDDSGLGATPEPDDTLDCQSSLLRSDTSEVVTSESESVDSDIHKSEKVAEKEPPKVPQKPYSRFKKCASVCYEDSDVNSSEIFQPRLTKKDLTISENISSTEPSDVEGHAADTEATSSEEDVTFSGQMSNLDSGLESLGDHRRGDLADSGSDLSQDSSTGLEKSQDKLPIDLPSDELEDTKTTEEKNDLQINEAYNHSFKLIIKHGDNRGFGFTLKGGKDQGCIPYVENVVKGGAADDAGLKDGDKIISINGDQTADHSHGSLVFSIKQAVYTGILDVVINRSENAAAVLNPEIKLRESRKGKSFAEKLAIFSAGITTPTNIEEPKSNTKLVDTKRESLVLRRRSAFENGKTQNENILNRRSSCISHSVNARPEKVLEKRHSVDFFMSQNTGPENNLGKKGPPPPVPVKPKIKSKPTFFDLNKSFIKSNDSVENNLSSPDSISNGTENNSSKSQSDPESLESFENNFPEPNQSPKPEEQVEPSESPRIDLTDNFAPQELASPFENPENSNVTSSADNQVSLNDDLQTSNDPTNFDAVGDNIADKIFTSFEANETVEQTGEFLDENETVFEANDETSYSIFNKSEDFNNSQEMLSENTNEMESEAGTSEDICTDVTCVPEETLLYANVQSTTEGAIEFLNDINSEDCLESNNAKEIETNSVSSACNSACDNEEGLSKSPISDSKDDPETEESEDTESKSKTQVNTSPLCLSFEKIDEDDVISASTTTSSDTPDTETVIETLPSNLSPLPNDESNGEDSSKLLNCQKEESSQILDSNIANEMSSNENNGENEIVQNYDEAEYEVDEQQDAEEAKQEETYSAAVLDGVNDEVDKTYYNDQQDDEYAQELEESLDQITSLDIIDRIEQSLMNQLQNEDSFEDISTNINSHLESDIDNDWFYYNDESEFYDLTPCNREPPSEPPPPPPPPENDDDLDKVISPFTRNNSTKRIKKELWRRRSDFLGIEPTKSIDLDIPPPPPGLEEILKEEVEQNQLMAKRLSLAEPQIDISSYSAESACIDSGNYSNNDYSDYFIDENDECAKETVIDPEQDSWKENMGEESLYETAFGIQYESASEPLSTVIEEPVKPSESPQHKVKINIHDLGAAPKAKIMDSTKWITEKVTTVNKKPVEPVFRHINYNQNYWLAQDEERRRSRQYADSHVDRRYSMPPVYSNTQPDVTVRTWEDREYEYQVQHRPKSAVYNTSGGGRNMYDQYMNIDKKDLQRTQSLDSHRDYDTDTLEPEVHKCSCCGKGLCEGSAMGIEALRLYFHIECFRCCVCHMQLGNGTCGTDVQVKDNQLYCPSCFNID